MNPNLDDEDEVVLDFIEHVEVNHGSTTVGQVVDQVSSN
jgi:predicted small metal-binding protein